MPSGRIQNHDLVVISLRVELHLKLLRARAVRPGPQQAIVPDGFTPVGEVALVLHDVRADAGGVAETPDVVTWDFFLALPNVQGDVCGRILGNLKTMLNFRTSEYI